LIRLNGVRCVMSKGAARAYYHSTAFWAGKRF